MARRPPNPNTAYGRKRMREEHEQWKANLHPEKRREYEDSYTGFYIVVVGIIMLIVYFILGSDGLLRWMSH